MSEVILCTADAVFHLRTDTERTYIFRKILQMEIARLYVWSFWNMLQKASCILHLWYFFSDHIFPLPSQITLTDKYIAYNYNSKNQLLHK